MAMANSTIAAASVARLNSRNARLIRRMWPVYSITDAREGARYAIVHGGQSGRVADSTMIANYVKSRTSLDNSIVVVPTWADPTNKTAGTTVAVKVKHAVPRYGPFLAAHTDSSTSTMVIVY